MGLFTIVGISRGNEFSPNHVGNDAAIFNKVVESLQGLECEVLSYTEKEFVSEQISADVVFNMARDKDTILRLKKLEDNGTLVINSAYGIENCVRKPMTELLIKEGIPHPKSQIVEVDDLEFTETCDYPFWIKRGDSHAMVKEDVCYATCKQEAIDILSDFKQRNIPNAVINEHLQGDLIKFYGVQGLNFFFWFYPSPCSHSKFGLEKINGEAKGIPFDENGLKEYCERASLALNVPVYGGDCVVSADGTIQIIDFNDWPSFARCKDEAGVSIAEYIVKQAEEKSK